MDGFHESRGLGHLSGMDMWRQWGLSGMWKAWMGVGGRNRVWNICSDNSNTRSVNDKEQIIN